jgi:hypothetical protein
VKLTFSALDTAQLAAEFAAADPFPHVVIDDFLVGDAQKLADAFPHPDWGGWTTRFRDRYQANKQACNDFDAIPGVLREIIVELQSSPAFLEFLEEVTGIEKLMSDPYLEGGGLHLSGAGGVLEPHTDFHVYPRLNLYRQVNVLVYVNPVWEEAWGGCLELFADKDAEQLTRKVVPVFGRCVIFRTDDDSVHGFPVPIAEGHTRRSIALYYYTAVDRPDYVGDKYTYWRRHGEHRGVDRLRFQLHKALVAGQRLVAKAARATRPAEPAPIETPPARDRQEESLTGPA